MRRQSNTGEYPVLDGDHNFSPEEWDTISDSFTDWLTAFVEAEGRMFWCQDNYGASVCPIVALSMQRRMSLKQQGGLDNEKE